MGAYGIIEMPPFKYLSTTDNHSDIHIIYLPLEFAPAFLAPAVGKAFSTLSDPQKRRQYDRFGEEGVQTAGRPTAREANPDPGPSFWDRDVPSRGAGDPGSAFFRPPPLRVGG